MVKLFKNRDLFLGVLCIHLGALFGMVDLFSWQMIIKLTFITIGIFLIMNSCDCKD